MRAFLIHIIAAGVMSQTFEPSDFNITEALIAQGINVSALPKLTALERRSSDLACNIAVSTLPSRLVKTQT
jgi:hypothetical protein